MTIKELIKYIGEEQKITIVGGFDEYSYHTILNVTTYAKLKHYYTETELMKICSYEVAKFYAMNNIIYITVYEN